MRAESLSQLAIAATVGTASRDVELDLPVPVADQLTGDRSSATAVLDAAALLTSANRAGAMLVEPVQPADEPAPESRPAPRGYAAPMTQLLQRARGVGDSGEGVVLDALAELAGAGGRLPTELLVPMLEWAAAEWNRLGGGRAALAPSALRRAAVLPVLGERGHWLAGLDPVWSELAAGGRSGPENPFADEAMELWHTGSGPERHQWLARVRRAHPDRAREIVELDLPSESAQSRVELLQGLADTLVPTDEPLLESALDDRSRKVAQTATTLLRRLPDSAWVDRAVERLKPLLHKGITGWKVSEPVPGSGGAEPGVARDQVDGAKLAELLAAVPVREWGGRLPPTLERAYRIVPEEARDGLVRATVIDGDAEAARMLLGRLGSRPDPGAVVQLAPLLPERQLGEIVVSEIVWLKPGQLDSLLDGIAGPWPDPVTEVVLSVVAGGSTRHKYGPAERAWLLERAERRARIDGADHVGTVRGIYHGADQPVLQRAASAAARTLTLRRTLHERLAALDHGHRPPDPDPRSTDHTTDQPTD